MGTMTTKKGMTVELKMSDTDALKLCGESNSTFGNDLFAKSKTGKLSYDQMAWAHKVANDLLTPKPEREKLVLGKFEQIFKMFETAKGFLKYPKIIFNGLSTELGGQLKMYVAGERSRFPGTVNVLYNDQWLGRILKDGTYEIKIKNESVEQFLQLFAQDPAKVAQEYGYMSKTCCFCNRELTDEVSVTLGFGPVCAKHYGVIYSKKEAEKAKEVANALA